MNLILTLTEKQNKQIMGLFKKRVDQDEKLLKNIKLYEQKEKAKQQESQILGQKPVKRKTNKEKGIGMYNPSRL